MPLASRYVTIDHLHHQLRGHHNTQLQRKTDTSKRKKWVKASVTLEQANTEERKEVQTMFYQTTHYVNPGSKGLYRLELYEDLLGDFIVTAFNGSRRVIHCHSTLKAAQHFYQEEHQRLITNKYEVLK